ncbi:hypothetical protein DFJ73DRAFT_912732 [Zopfochytrium polystomum]|nr:hypothetical protein DFJ73DRAFT_912732 [Zopfochytrium polystomum]
MHILVVGGGVSGPAAALALKRAGHDVELFDRVLDFLDTPGGLNIHENGLRMRKINGDPVASFPTSRSCDLVQINILRTTLSRILTNTLIQEGVYVHANKQLIGIEQPTDGSLGVRAKFHDGSVAVGDILIGADGVHSCVRQCLFPDRKPSKYGIVGYFGVVDLDPSTINWTSHGHHFFTDNVSAKSGMVMRVSDTQLCWLLFELKQSEINLDSWKPQLDIRKDRATSAEMAWRWGLPDVFQPMILGAKEILPLTIYDLETLPHWSKQNCVLVGSAKHAMVPFLGQTCGVGLEDAEVLAALISRFPGDPRKAFHLYQEARYQRVKKIAEAARVQGKRQYSTTPFSARMGQLVMKFVSATSGSLASEEIVEYDGHEAVTEILFRNGYL